MLNLKKLEVNRLIKELEYVKSDYEFKSEVLKEADILFLNGVDDLLNRNSELKSIYNDRVEKKILEKIEYKKNQDVFQDDFKEDNKTDKIKKLYRQIVKITHPDKIVDSILNKMYLAANDYYDSNDILGIYKICDQLSIEYEIDTNDIDLIKDQISVMKDRISFIESTLAWKWYSEENINKNELLINYIRSQII